MKYLNEEQIKNELNDYIYNVNIKYATLLNGSWGSGKTYFVKNYIKQLELEYKKNKSNKPKKPVYISLYGLNNISEIKNKVFLSSIKNACSKQLLSVINLSLEVLIPFITSKIPIKNPKKYINYLANSLYEIDNLIIFFDDLERCNIDINSILGYINELVEHNNVKIILIADETKIGKATYQNNLELKYLTALSNNIKINDEVSSGVSQNIATQHCKVKLTKEELTKRAKHLFNEDAIYSEIKEKLIGKIIYYSSNIDDIYDKFMDIIITNDAAKQTVKNQKENSLAMLENEKHYNLRTLQFIFHYFDRLVKETLNFINNKSVEVIYLNTLFNYCTIKSLYVRQGKNYYNWEENQEFGAIYLGNPSTVPVYSNYVIGFRFVDDYIENSCLDKEKIKLILGNYEKMISNNVANPSDPLYKLKHCYIIPEQELKTLIEELIAKIENNSYDLELYSNIVRYLSCVEEIGVCKMEIDIAIKKLEENITKGIVNGKYTESVIFSTSEQDPELHKLYDKNISNIKMLINQKEKNDDSTQVNAIYSSDDWGSKLEDYCNANNYKFKENKNFANILNISEIIFNIQHKNIEQIYKFAYTLQTVYNNCNIEDCYKNDKSKLIELKKELIKITDIDKVRLFAINNLIKFLEKVTSTSN